jgi:hypothetical protein
MRCKSIRKVVFLLLFSRLIVTLWRKKYEKNHEKPDIDIGSVRH